MKKIFCFIFIILFAFSLCSCGENMKSLLKYQAYPISARVKIADKSGEYEAIITFISDNERKIRLLSHKTLNDMEIVFLDGQKKIFCDGIEISLSNIDKENDKFYQYTDIFCISPSGRWKIKKGENLGNSVYICDNGEIVVYISSKPNCPCKFSVGESVIEVIEILK